MIRDPSRSTASNRQLGHHSNVGSARTQSCRICSAVVGQVYEGGLQFRTPEAITAVHTFRACHYLRAMAIWALWATHTGWQPIVVNKA